MLLERIKDFNWVNEPKNVEFIEKGLLITAKEQTDFWQNSAFNISKDDGHFFACVKEGDFILSAKWCFEKTIESAQCGIMVKSDYDYPLKNSYTYSDSFAVADVEGEVIVVRALVTVTREDGVVKNENLDIRMIEEVSGWRLLTPTYVVYNKYTEIYDNLNK